MAITEQLILDLNQALNQIQQLEGELDSLLAPVTVPVNFDISDPNFGGEGAEGIRELQREIDDAQDEAADFRRELDRTGDEAESLGRRGSSAFSAFGRSLAGAAAGVAALVSAREVFSFFGDAVSAASDLEESTSKAQVVFGQFAEDIQDFATTAPSALGLANQEALEFTATFGNLFTALGLSQQAAAELSPEIVQLGSDLASFNNIEVDEALTALRSGLVGEVEPLRRLGVAINAAAVETKALELGLVGANGEIDEAAKVQARYALILEQTTNAQGDFARTSDSIANRQRTINAEFENFRAEVGTALVPAFEALLDAAPALLEALQGLVPVLSDFADTLAEIDFGAAIEGVRTFGNTASGVISLLQGDVGSFRISKAINDFNTSVDEGIDPTRAFEAVLTRIANQDLAAGQIEELVNQLQGFANLDAADLNLIAQNVREFGVAAGLTETQAQALANSLFSIADAEAEIPPDPFAGLDEGIEVFERLGQTAETTSIDLVTFGTAFGELGREIQGLDFGDTIEAFTSLPSALSEVGDALEDEEGNIVTDFSVFLGNLQDEIAEQVEFNRLIAELREIAPNLADQLLEDLQPGPEANALLADAIANPLESVEAENAILAAAQANADLYANQFADDVAGLLSAIEPILFPLTGVVEGVTIANPDVSIAGGFGGGVQEGTGGTTIIQNFDNTPSPNTETSRAAQSAAAVIANNSGPF